MMSHKPFPVIFVVGNSRSGTTMMGRILGRHPDIHTFGELHFFEQQVDAETVRSRPAWSEEQCLALLERLLTTARDGFFARVEAGKYKEDAERILEIVNARDPVFVYRAFLFFETHRSGKVIPCEQTPRYLFFVREILEVFPESVVINMVRDPRAVLLSQKNKWRRRFLGARNIPLSEVVRAWANYHPYIISRLWVAAVRAARPYTGHPRFVSIRYEDLLDKPEETVRAICSYIGVEYHPGMLEVPQVGSSSGMDRPDRCGIDASRMGAWRKGGLTKTELSICERVCKEELQRLGYECNNPQAAFWRIWLSMGGFVFKAILALALNLKRTKNLRETFRRRMS